MCWKSFDTNSIKTWTTFIPNQVWKSQVTNNLRLPQIHLKESLQIDSMAPIAYRWQPWLTSNNKLSCSSNSNIKVWWCLRHCNKVQTPLPTHTGLPPRLCLRCASFILQSIFWSKKTVFAFGALKWKSKPEAERSSGKKTENNMKSSEPPKQDYIHVWVRRGAADSHSLAKRVSFF